MLDDYTATTLARQREQLLRSAALRDTSKIDDKPLRRRVARRLHRIARAVDVTDL